MNTSRLGSASGR